MKGSYQCWMEGRRVSRVVRIASHNPLITVIIFGDDGDACKMARTLEALLEQTYKNIEVLVVGREWDVTEYFAAFNSMRGLSTRPEIRHTELLAAPDHDGAWRGDYVMFARAGTTFDRDCFALVNSALDMAAGQSPGLVVIDHDHAGTDGSRVEPVLLPGWDPDLVLCTDVCDTAFVASRELVTEQRRAGTPGSLYDWLRGVAGRPVQPVTVHVSEPVVHIAEPAPRATQWRPVSPLPWEDRPPGEWPAMAIVIPNRDHPELMRLCSGFLERPIKFRPEIIIVDNQSDDVGTLKIYDELVERYGARVVPAGPVFNYSRMINLGVAAASAEFVMLMNNDIDFSMPGQMEQLLLNAMRPEVGIAGTQLLYPDGTIQHAGILIEVSPSSEFHATHVLRGGNPDAVHPIYPPRVARNYQSVTGAVQVMRREVFAAAGGYDEVHLPIEYNDIDFCLRVRRAGLRVVSLPLERVFHLESISRNGWSSIPPADVMRHDAATTMMARWADAARNDPFSNPWISVSDRPDVLLSWIDSQSPETGGRNDGKVSEGKRDLRWALRHPRKAVFRMIGLPERAANPVEPNSVQANAAREDAAPEASVSRYAAGEARRPRRQLRTGLAVYGYLGSEVGLGQAARNLVYAADSVRLPVSACSLALDERGNDPEFLSKSNKVSDRVASLLVMNLLGAQPTKIRMAPGRFNILYPYWELGRIPAQCVDHLREFDEIWAPSRFVASAFKNGFDRPVRLLRQPVRLPHSMPRPRTKRDALRVFTFFDFDSYIARKNPQATVRAFRSAFPETRKDVELLIKARGANDQTVRQWIVDEAARDPRIKFVDRTLSREEMDELMAGSDVFISLHRSEGFGFGAAEALAAGKAVVATDYGGTTDFIDERTGFPVPYELEPVGRDDFVDTHEQVWASASIDAAAAALRSIYDSPDDAAGRTRRGFDLLTENHSPSSVGAAMAVLLEDRGLL